MTMKQEYRQRVLFSKFMDHTDFFFKPHDWNAIMQIADKIEKIIGHAIDINNEISLCWWFHKRSATFDAIKGKFYQVVVYFHPEQKDKRKFRPWVENKKEAMLLAMETFIEWYKNTRIIIGKHSS